MTFIQEFAQNGLRTLCCAVRDIDPTFYAEWQKRYHIARSASTLWFYSAVFHCSPLLSDAAVQVTGSTCVQLSVPLSLNVLESRDVNEARVS